VPACAAGLRGAAGGPGLPPPAHTRGTTPRCSPARRRPWAAARARGRWPLLVGEEGPLGHGEGRCVSRGTRWGCAARGPAGIGPSAWPRSGAPWAAPSCARSWVTGASPQQSPCCLGRTGGCGRHGRADAAPTAERARRGQAGAAQVAGGAGAGAGAGAGCTTGGEEGPTVVILQPQTVRPWPLPLQLACMPLASPVALWRQSCS